MEGQQLIVPCYLGGDVQKLVAVEVIDGEGHKRTLKGAQAAGAFWVPNDFEERIKRDKKAFIAEGIATALSVSQVCGAPCVAARYCGNLKATARALKKSIGRRRIELVVCADIGNGELDAREAATAVGGGFMRPQFGAELVAAFKERTGGDRPTDFNDYFIATGDL